MDQQNYIQHLDASLAHPENDNPTNTTQKRPRRRPLKNLVSDNDDPNKSGKRGRPRVEAQNQNAVERRRTQIRLAQRAYRERKETTIATLEKRVAQLEHTVGEMSQAFLDYNDKAISSGLASRSPDLGKDLKLTLEAFLALVRYANPTPEAEEVSGVFSGTEAETTEDQNGQARPSESIKTSSKLPSARHSVDSNSGMQDTVLGYEISHVGNVKAGKDDTDDIVSSRPTAEHDGATNSNNISLWSDPSKHITHIRADLQYTPVFTEEWNSTVDQGPRPLYTYSFQESTFARRLLRASYERTYHLLTNPNASRQEINRVLRYGFCFGDIPAIIEKIGQLLKRSRKESLEQWDMPSLHIGGAGLHFPRTQLDIEPPPQNWSDPYSMGPYRYNPQAPKRAPIADYPRMLQSFTDIEGVWFDSNDVEHYLRTKGLYLDGSCSIAEIEIDDPLPAMLPDNLAGSPSSSTSGTFTEPHSPQSAYDVMANSSYQPRSYCPDIQDVNFAQIPMSNGEMAGVNIDAPFVWSNDAAYGKFNTPSSLTEPNAFLGAAPPQYTKAKKKLIVDVDRLLESFNERCICLGRAPGYRQEDVDSALDAVVKAALW